MTKRFKPRKTKEKKQRWATWNVKLDKYDIIIDLANIRRISKRMYETGKVSDKVLKKWMKRDYNIHDHGCYHYKRRCIWIPSVAFRKKYTSGNMFQWACKRCHSVTAWVYDDELSEPLQKAFPERTHTKRWY